jgi:hypothetical protein
MRLLLSSIILAITALDFSFGEQHNGYRVASLLAGLLLALTVVADHLRQDRKPPPPSTEPDVTIESTVDPTADRTAP